MKIGVFDSGVGGLSVTNAIKVALPDHEILYADDHEHVPYGTRKPNELLTFVEPILEGLINKGCEVIVIACNTVSTTIIDELREKIGVQLIAVEPMIEVATRLTKNGVIAVCATPTTLASQRYKSLKDQFAQNITILEPDCSDWATMIENKAVDEQRLEARIAEALQSGADVIVLGCTHYHWIEEVIIALSADKARVIQPEPTIIEELRRAIEQLA